MPHGCILKIEYLYRLAIPCRCYAMHNRLPRGQGNQVDIAEKFLKLLTRSKILPGLREGEQVQLVPFSRQSLCEMINFELITPVRRVRRTVSEK